MSRFAAGLFLALISVAPHLSAQDTWQVRVTVDPITDDSITLARISGWSGDREADASSGRPTLNLRCNSGSRYQEFFVNTQRTFLNRGDRIPFIMRVDRNEQVYGEFSPSTEGDGAFLESRTEEVLSSILPQMRDGVLLRVRMTDFRGTNHDFEYSLTGFTAAVERLPCFSALLHPVLQEEPFEGARPDSVAEVAPAEEQEELSKEPSFTPYTDPPTLLNRAEIGRALEREYPALLRDAGIGGTTEVWFFIDTQGVVGNIQVKESSGHKALDDAALRVAEVIEFTPGKRSGQLVPVWISLPITFSPRRHLTASRGQIAGR